MADMENFYDDLIIINLYYTQNLSNPTDSNLSVWQQGWNDVGFTPSIAEIICVKNVGAIVVCGFFMK